MEALSWQVTQTNHCGALPARSNTPQEIIMCYSILWCTTIYSNMIQDLADITICTYDDILQYVLTSTRPM